MIYDFQRILAYRLLAWSALSLIAGGWLFQAGDSFQRGFGLQDTAWGLVDLVIALFALRGLRNSLTNPVDLAEAASKTHWLRRILAVNAGLDLVYIAGGVILWLTLGRMDAFDAGMGLGILVQGSFLLFFDGLHALFIPTEIVLPDWQLFDGSEHASFQLEGGRPAALFIHGFPDTPVAIRDLADSLQARGWTVAGLLLPGFGAQLPGLYQRRVDEWTAAICQEVERLKRGHSPVLLVGFSMGAGLSIPAAVQSSPDGLALLSPFWWRETIWVKILVTLLRLFGPVSFTIGRFVNLDNPDLNKGVDQIAPGVSLADPMVREALRTLRVPFSFLEQFRLLGQTVQASAPRWQGPTLIIQGRQDPVARPALTRRLLAMLGAPAKYCELPGGHNLNLPGHPSYAQVIAELASFADSLLNP